MIDTKEIGYQNEALWGCVEEGQEGLISITNRLLKANVKNNNYPEVILKAITGAGKTIIMSNYIKKMYEQDNKTPMVFVWLSIGTGGLQFQSSEKITPLLIPYGISVICPKTEKQFNETEFHDKTLLILNWEKINNTKKDELASNLMVGEKHNLKKAIQNTSKEIKFIVLIDEFHKNYRTDAYSLIMNLFRTSMILGMTATPTKDQMANKYSLHNVPTAKVKESGMIKLGTVFNENCSKIDLEKESNIGLDEAILEIAMAKRVELERKFRLEDSNVIPLCLIQVPNADKEFLEKIIKFLSSHEENGQPLIENEDYTCWLSDIPQNKDAIKNITTNNIKYLIFKQAVATGWDCPRTHILIKYRPLKVKLDAFDLQTIGRVLRTPERTLYETEDLNYAYIYAPEPRFTFDKEVEDALGNPETRNKKITYNDDILIFEEFLETERLEETPLNFSEVKSIFLGILNRKYTESKVNGEYEKIHIFDGKIETSDELLSDSVEIKGVDNIIKYNSIQLGRKFESFLKTLEKPYLSQNDLKAILFNFFQDKISVKFEDEDGILECIKMCLMYKESITKTILLTGNKIHQDTERVKTDNKPFIFQRNPKYLVENKINFYSKCLYKPCAYSGLSEPEHIFIQELEKNKNVKWWYKNLDKGQNALSIIYIEEEGRRKGQQYEILAPTQPDFIVCFKENERLSLGIYEIKDVDKVEDANDRKHLAIQTFITKLNKRIKDNNSIETIYGGLVKIKNLHNIDENNQFIGEIQNINIFDELRR